MRFRHVESVIWREFRKQSAPRKIRWIRKKAVGMIVPQDQVHMERDIDCVCYIAWNSLEGAHSFILMDWSLFGDPKRG